MKKVLSVLLAAAMVMGMSVTSMAKVTFGADTTDDIDNGYATVNDVLAGFDNRVVVIEPNSERVNGVAVYSLPDDDEAIDLQPGADLYFPMQEWVLDCGKEEHKEHTVDCCNITAHDTPHANGTALQPHCTYDHETHTH